MMNIVLAIAALMFAVAVVAAIYRIVRGPAHVDRIVAADVLTAAIVCLLGVWMIVTEDTTLMPVLLALALFAVVGSVSVARFMSQRNDD